MMPPTWRLMVTFPHYSTGPAAGLRGVCSCSPTAGDSVKKLEAPSLALAHSPLPLASVWLVLSHWHMCQVWLGL